MVGHTRPVVLMGFFFFLKSDKLLAFQAAQQKSNLEQ